MEAILETTGNKQFGALLFSRSRVKYSNGPLRIQTAHFSRLEQPRREREREARQSLSGLFQAVV